MVKFESDKVSRRILTTSLFFEIWGGTFVNTMYYNVFDIKIVSFRAALILVYVQHNKTHSADPANEIAMFFVFSKYIKWRCKLCFNLIKICLSIDFSYQTQKRNRCLNLSLMLSIIWCIFETQKTLPFHLHDQQDVFCCVERKLVLNLIQMMWF